MKQIYSVAREHDGRVAMRLKSQHPGDPTIISVTICDPVAGTTMHFAQCFDKDGAPATGGGLPRSCSEKVAKVLRSPHRALDAGPPFFPDPSMPLPPHIASSFASRGGETADLGTKIINGIQAHGYRNLTSGPSHMDACKSPVEEVREWWISEEMALALSDVNTTLSEHVDPKPSSTTTQVTCSFKTSVQLSNIQHVEPAPELFEIPEGYKVVSIAPPVPNNEPQQ